MDYVSYEPDRSSVVSGGSHYASSYAPRNILTIGDRTFEVTIVYRDDAGEVVDTQGIDETTSKVQNLATKLFQEAKIADNQNYVIINGEGVHTPETDNEILGRYREDIYGPLETLSPDDHPILNTWTTLYEEITGTRTVPEDLSFEERRDTFPTFEAFAERYNALSTSRSSDATPEWALYNIKFNNFNGIVGDAVRILADLCNEEDLADVADKMIRENSLELEWAPALDEDDEYFANMRQMEQDKSEGYPYTIEQLAALEAITARSFF